MTFQTFPTAAAAREFLISQGFEAFRKGLTKGRFVSKTGRVAFYGMCLIGETQWGYSVRVGA